MALLDLDFSLPYLIVENFMKILAVADAVSTHVLSPWQEMNDFTFKKPKPKKLNK